MFNFILFAILWVALSVLIMRFDQKMKKTGEVLEKTKEATEQMHDVMTQAGVVVAAGNKLNKQRELQMHIHNEIHDAHLSALEEERKTWTAERKNYEAAITKQTKERKKKIRGKRRRGR
ncbi:hypothetical protein [Halalkalibacter krulwichiae]|uniref:Uncharacterized protein n=1 Tax=Halalkalibacter krulwichiae TaxID=199441 RepID=A0A1X9MIN6_9BACI|nr:hypothetical protein [Halalkalibacter krulwichiae]ARK32153.1 hypothetical protein BkAM31D_21170 [Halalkalibacter krulwichiae]